MAKNNLKNLWNKVKKALGGSSSTSKKKTTRQTSMYSAPKVSGYNQKAQTSSKKSTTSKSKKTTNEAPIRTRTSTEYSSVNNNAMASRKLIREIETKTKASDIAPVKKKKKEDDEKWFKKGAFEDGYQVGDVTKTVASTVGDAGLNLAKGVGSLGEGVLDLGRYGVAEIGESLGAENFANRQRVKAQENSIDNFFKDVETGVDQWSILGGKSDAVMQGLGQVGGIILTGGIGAGAGLTSVGATALTTGLMGASSMGSGMTEAYQNEATDEEAWKYGAIKGVVDAGSEMIFGGLGKTVKAIGLSKGLSSLDDAFAQKLSSKISNQFVKNLTEYGVKSSAEGLEEVLAGLGSAVGKKLTYASEEELNELIKDENLLDQFVVGAVTSGIAQSGLVPGMSQGSLKEANKTGRDFITGYTQNEQKVVDKVVESRIAEQEADGKKLTNKEKGKIAEEVEEELKKGYIDIDTIESTLGGETYKNYKSAVDNEAKLQEEYDTLHKMERGKMTGEQIDRETELKSQLDELKNNSKTSQMREQLDFEISKLTEKDTLLRESYNERSRRGQSFEADLTKYDAKQQEVIKKATESGILNNTNRTHEFVDMVAKISADKGVSFDFTSNEKLKESGFAIDGKTINGYIKDGNIAVNINSNKALNTVVGHEITHVLEGTELYTELQNAVKEYATTKGEYDTRYKALQGIYKDVDSAVIENEITADLVGDYLFTDADFVNRLSADKPNVFKKIYDEIKYLVKTVTGTKESRELAKVQKLFEDAYKNSANTKTDTKYSLSDTKKRTLTAEQQEHFKDSKIRDDNGNLKVMYHGSPEAFTVFDKRKAKSSGLYGRGFYFTESESHAQQYGSQYEVYLNITNPIQNGTNNITKDQLRNFVEALAENEDYGIENYGYGATVDSITDDVYGKDDFAMLMDLNVTCVGNMVEAIELFNEVNGTDYNGIVAPTETVAFYPNQIKKVDNQKPTSDSDIRYSLSDSDGNKLTKEQQEFYKDSKVRDENGNLKVMYHGTEKGGFHEFIQDFSDDETSFFFTDNNATAKSYSGTHENYVAQTLRTADDFNKFFASVNADDYEVREENGQFVLYEDGDEVATSDTADGIYEEFRDWTGLGYGSSNYKVYLNLKNPLVVDAKRNNWDEVSSEFSQELYDRYQTLTTDEKEALTSIAEWDDMGVFRDEINGAVAKVERGTKEEYARNLASAYEKLGGEDVNMYRLFDVAMDDFSEESIRANSLKYLTTRDYAQRGKEQGYDGVIFKNIVDNGLYASGMERFTPSTVAIAFDSNQIKSVDNKQPTSDADIRFSLSKSVEETKDLLAVHNLRGEELIKTLELGGLPMPSIAVIKAQDGHEMYGDVTLILPKESIDPKLNYENKVYGGDAWTPTYPKIEYKPKEKVAKKIRDKYYDFAKQYGYDEARPLYRYVSELEDSLNRDGGEEALLEKLYDDTKMMQMFLQDSGKEKVQDVVKETVTKISEAEAEMNQFLLDTLGNELITGFEVPYGENPIKHRRVYMEEHEEEIRNAYAKLCKEVYDFNDEEVQNVLDNTDRKELMKIMRGAYMYSKNNGVTVKTETDYEATKEAIRNSAKDGYKEWVDGLFKGVEEKSGIRNNVEVFTRNGNRRSWNALHWENTLENVVKVMKQQDNGQAFFGGMGIWGVSAKEYGSIEEIKADSDRLRKMSDEEYAEVKESYQNRLSDIASKIMSKTERNQFIALDNAMECIVDAVRTSKTPKGVFKELKQYKQLNVTEKDANDIVALVNDIANMPTGYFEAKPQRAVGLDEVGVFVIPNNSDAKLKQELLNKGYSIAEYNPELEGDRKRVVNQFEDLKFSLSDNGNNQNDKYSFNAPIRDGYAPLTEAQANERDAQQRGGIFALNENDMPPEFDAPYYEELDTEPVNPFDERDIDEVGKRNVKAYMYENPEVKPFFQEEAQIMLRELQDSTKGEKQFNSQLYYETGGEQGWFGTKRQTSEEVAYLLDRFNYTYADIEKGLKAIIEDHGAENNAISKRIEFMIDERLREGYTDFTSGYDIPNNPDYIDLLKNKNITEYTDEAYNNWLQSLAGEEPNDGITFDSTVEQPKVEDIAPVKASEEKQAKPKRATKKQAKPKVKGTTEHQEIAKILDVEPKTESQRNSRKWAIFKANVFDKGAVFEDLSLKKKNRELMGKWNFTLYSDARAQRLIGNGDEKNNVKALNSIIEEVGKDGLTSSLQEYLYHKHNVDRMTLSNRFKDAENKAVFGDNVTAEMSQEIVDQYEFAEPKLMEYAEQIYNYNKHLRKMMVDGGVISQETADLWEKMYPHYVPIRRVNDTGLNVNVPLDTGRTGVNAPIKRATGGSADILPLFDTMAMRTLQTYKAVAKNNFGVELKNTLGGETVSMPTTVDELIDSLDAQEDLLQEGKNGSKPTFTVFENGERVTFEITEDMYDALKPVSDSSLLSKTIKPLNIASNIHRGLLTEYNPVFLLTNGIKDIQDILINSQHATRTYLKIPEAHLQVLKKGYWYNEYMANGGEQNTYFDNETNTFETKEESTAKKVITFPLKAISRVNNYVEVIPRLAEYIASRESGRSVEVSMLDSARVTTNFRAGGDLTKFINRNGGTFLNASVQGAMQQVRNVREANANGLKGWANLVTKFAIAGAPAFILNNLIWDDDDEYEELSDYVKQNYYIVGKYGDGQFIRIPKGRTVAVIQEGIRQIGNKVTGNDEADLNSFLEFVVTNLAPNNPLENNVLAPIMQVKNNETWYGEDLVPTRLQDLPVSEQFDESTDSLSRAIGEKFDISPIKVNYLLDQYTGGVGDVVLPMLTPEAESGDDSLVGNLLAPLKKKFTTDSVMNNQNVSDFYAMSDELKLNANKVDATEEDILHNKYMSAIRGDMGELYAKKRELQNSGLSNKAKYEQVREIQKQIDELAKDAMYQINTFGGADIYGRYATVGEKQFLKNDEGEWRTISEERVEKQKEASKLLGITAQEYWKNDDDKYAYDWAVKYPEYYQVSRAISDDLLTYWKHNDHMWNNIRADKDENGKSISGSKKKKIIEYINGIDDLSYEEKLVLFKKYYPADDTYNYEIIDYLNSREDITYEQMETILKELDFKVDSQGNITW